MDGAPPPFDTGADARLAAAGVANQADVERLESTPLSARNLPPSTFAQLREGLQRAGARPALSLLCDAQELDPLHTLSGDALLEQIIRTANAFRRLGLGRTDVVALILPNLPETHLAIWGGEAAGIVFPLNPALGAEQLAGMLRAARAKFVVALGPTPGTDSWERTRLAVSQTPSVRVVLAVNPARYIDEPDSSALRLGHGLLRQCIGGARVLDFHKQLAWSKGEQLDFNEPKSHDIASYFCTGGTTGAPKIARRTHGSEVFNSWAIGAVMGDAYAAGRTVFSALPLFHVNAQLVSGLAAFSRGQHVLLGTPQGYRGKGVIARFWEMVERYRVNAFSCVPTVLSALLQHPVGDRDISSLDLVICGAAPMPKDLFRAFEQATGRAVIEGYGLTEGGCVSSVNPRAGERRIGSIGLRLPYQDMRVLILDESGGWVRDAGADETGVLAIRGPNVFAGYLSPEHNRGVWIDRRGEIWLNTGDLARRDADGYFWLTGRRKELIIRGGHNIDPKIIEEALADHPAVALAAAVGRPDAHAGEVPVAYVQLHEHARTSESELLVFAAGKLAERAAWPKAVRILPALPTTDVGKIFKPALTLMEIESVVREECAAAGVSPLNVACAVPSSGKALAVIELDQGAPALAERLRQFTFGWEIRAGGEVLSG